MMSIDSFRFLQNKKITSSKETLPKTVNIILSVIHLADHKQEYKTIHSLEEMESIFLNQNFLFEINEKKYKLSYNQMNSEVVLQKNNTNKIISTFNNTTHIEHIFSVFGKL